MSKLHFVPPSPEVMASLYMEYRRSDYAETMSFGKYLGEIGFTNPAENIVGMDDGAQFLAGAKGPELIDIPAHPVTGKLQVKVLLIDFPDRPGRLSPEHFHDMLFSLDTHPSGSMRDYYREVSLGKVDVEGTVHGWLRMPNSYAYYTNNRSGFADYPNNAQKMAEDAVDVALQNNIRFEKELDKLNQGIITALFIIHAGQGAEELHRSISGGEIWSHKWNLRNPVQVSQDLFASIYLTVPENCKVGVCAHELGHLAFQWQDFYDPNYDEDGKEWDGSGVWDLMAGGSWNGGGSTPAHPAALHKLQHGWITVTTLEKSRSITLQPYSPQQGHVYKIVSPQYDPQQYLILENRTRRGFDFYLPGEGLLVWRVDERGAMLAPDEPGMLLVQADGKHDLEKSGDKNRGDAGDPFPGEARRHTLKDIGSISTSFPDGRRSGISFANIQRDFQSGNITLDVTFIGDGDNSSKKRSKNRSRAKV